MNKKLLYGIANNDADYVTQNSIVISGSKSTGDLKRKVLWVCPYYNRWTNMLKRCYSVETNRRPTYIDCKVCEEWLTFSNFKAWKKRKHELADSEYVDDEIVAEALRNRYKNYNTVEDFII